MSRFAEPVVVLSECLEQEACRYNAQMVRDDFVRELTPYVRWIAVCPEVEIGLGVPRDPIRLIRIDGRSRLVQPSTWRDVTDAMDGFAARFLGALPPVDGFLLTNRSPSCGIKDVKVYAPSAASHGKQAGAFAAFVLEKYGTFFAALLTDYRTRRKPLAAVTSVLASWIERFDVGYLQGQTFFAPFPPPLATVDEA